MFCNDSSRKLCTERPFNDNSTMTPAYLTTNTQLGFQTAIYMAELGLKRPISCYRKWDDDIYKYRCYQVDLGYGAKTIININKKSNSMFVISLSSYTFITRFERLCLSLICSIFRTLLAYLLTYLLHGAEFFLGS